MKSNTSPLGPGNAPDSATAHQPAARIFGCLMIGYAESASMRLWNNMQHAHGDQSPSPMLVVRDPFVLRRAILERSPLLLADAYFRGMLDFEVEMYSALSLKTHFERLLPTWHDKLYLLRQHWGHVLGCSPVH